MNDLIRKFLSSQWIFWLGFLAGSLFWWILNRLRPTFSTIREFIAERASQQKERSSHIEEIHLANAMLAKAQSWHLATPLFQLDEIIISPRVMSPPIEFENFENPLGVDITDTVIPYCPDYPEMAAFYNAPSLTLLEALQGGANLILMGHPGSGKSVALAHLTTILAREVNRANGDKHFIPFLLHIAEIDLPLREDQTPVDALVGTLRDAKISVSLSIVKELINSLSKSGRLLVLLDGLDELPKEGFDHAVNFLKRLITDNPDIRFIATSSLNYYDALVELGAYPLAIAAWNGDQIENYIRKWITQWETKITPIASHKSEPISPLLIYGWIKSKVELISPFELTLLLWSATAGDGIGNTITDTIEAYIRRSTQELPAKAREALEISAAFITASSWGVLKPGAGRKPSTTIQDGDDNYSSQDDVLQIPENERIIRDFQKSNIFSYLPELIAHGLINKRGDYAYSFAHPILQAYLASQKINLYDGLLTPLINQKYWCTSDETLKFLALATQSPYWLDEFVQDENASPTLHELLTAAHWLPECSDDNLWKKQIMRQLATVLQTEGLPETLHARALIALIRLGETGVDALLRKMLISEKTYLRHLAALGCGMLRDKQSRSILNDLLIDISPRVRKAALLALVAIGDQDSLESVAYSLIKGDEMQKRAAAQALSNHKEEGVPALEEGSMHGDAKVRQAVIYGLARNGTPASWEIISKLQLEDEEWLVQDTATQALALRENINPRVPKPKPPLHQATWLIDFGSEHGIGIAPGKPAKDLLIRLLREGSESQIVNALSYLSTQASEDYLLPLYQIYFSRSEDIQELAFFALEHIQRTGTHLPSPVQYGLRSLSE